MNDNPNEIVLNYYENKLVKSALHRLMKSAISDLDKSSTLLIVNRGFEINYRGRRIRVVLSIDEVGDDV